jgi:hypothetical protein
VFECADLPRLFAGEDQQEMHSYQLGNWAEAADSLIYVPTETVYFGQRQHLTEKTFKAIALEMPFVLVAPAHSLEYLRSYGFKTFDGIFDESYDTTDVFQDKLNIILHNITNFAGAPFDQETIRRTEHNYNLFYNTDRILSGLKEELINPILEFIQRK